ncbi:MAG: hypothetical protein FJZ43_00810 [Candidatus Staskawiczbacteria bacterium]|nr:hypothetical protein [Candidatus Staskawiczbacteria bacterium]
MQQPNQPNKQPKNDLPKTMSMDRFRQISLSASDKTTSRGLGHHISDYKERGSLHHDFFNPGQQITHKLLEEKIEHAKKMEDAARIRFRMEGHKGDLEEIDKQRDHRTILEKALKEFGKEGHESH